MSQVVEASVARNDDQGMICLKLLLHR
jgi:hypothetical protein